MEWEVVDRDEPYYEPIEDYAEHDPQHAHCLNCHMLKCDYQGSDCCPMEACSSCFVSLHHCKLEDHRENVCLKIFVPCLNSPFGCQQRVRRDKLGTHLFTCSASVVVCTREWCRKAHTEKEKMILKNWGKGRIVRIETEAPEDSPDVAWALHDQEVIIKSYGFGRKSRVRRRERIHPKHPLLPLRAIEAEEDAHLQEDAENSSDEEKRVKAEKLKKKQAMFANCYMCHVDPTTQHLHTLGNDKMKFELMKPVKRFGRPVDALHSRHNLMVDTVVYTFHDSYRKGSNLGIFTNGGSLLYNFRCLQNVHRRDFGNHHLAMHSNIFDTLQDYVLRCPNFARGCEFIDSRCRPLKGALRYLPGIRHICHVREPFTNNATTAVRESPTNLEVMPDWVFEEIGQYLPGSSLFNLSLCSKSLRFKVFHVLRQNCLIVPKWKKSNGEWCLEKFIEELSISEPPPQVVWQLPGKLVDHLQNCEFFERVNYGDSDKVPVFFDKTGLITSEFAERLPKAQAYWKHYAVENMLMGDGIVALNAWM